MKPMLFGGLEFALWIGLLPVDSLSTLLHQQQVTPWILATTAAIAIVLGGAHALTPGHGKTIVAAYLVGSRGTIKHALLLGVIVTFTHTISVFLLGIATMFLFHYIVPQQVTRILAAISGMSIVVIGAWMLQKRLRAADHNHSHAHHHHRGLDHQDTAHGHSHNPNRDQDLQDTVSWSSLVALGASGGLVPCESALVLLLTAIALRRVLLGLLLLACFSLGLACVLMGIGVIVIYAKNALDRSIIASAHFRWIPAASAGVVLLLGALMTAVSFGWIQMKWIVG